MPDDDLAGACGVNATWTPFNWDSWDTHASKRVRPNIRDVINGHRGHAVQERIGFFGPEYVMCTDCRQTLWSVDETNSFGWN